ncbi:hypothetical protein [Bartonella sp. MR30HLJHH]|uniref:hypothetical protein n=1 Tax=Bartonella sp. MR30HLJHH TaxID=3243557 RepID=UPI0035CFC7CD
MKILSFAGPISSKWNWKEPKCLILAKNTVYTNLHTVIVGAKSNEFSLAIFKPARIKKFSFKPINPIRNPKREEVVYELIRQGSFFDKTNNFIRTKKLPYKFSYEFTDDKNVNSTLMIADWEIGQLYWNCRKRVKSDKEAIQLVQQKYYNDIANTKDVYFFRNNV